MKQSTTFIVFVAGLLVLMAIPMAMLVGLHMGGPEWYWARTGNVLTDWSIWYLDVLPFWIVAFVPVLAGKKKLGFEIAKAEIFFWLFAWLFYDWVWQAIAGAASPETWDWNAAFYFDIAWHPTPMWLFLAMALAGAVLGLSELRVVKKPRQLVPFVLWLIFIYGMGGVTQVIHVDWTAWVYYDAVMTIAVLAAFKLTIWK